MLTLREGTYNSSLNGNVISTVRQWFLAEGNQIQDRMTVVYAGIMPMATRLTHPTTAVEAANYRANRIQVLQILPLNPTHHDPVGGLPSCPPLAQHQQYVPPIRIVPIRPVQVVHQVPIPPQPRNQNEDSEEDDPVHL